MVPTGIRPTGRAGTMVFRCCTGTRMPAITAPTGASSTSASTSTISRPSASPSSTSGSAACRASRHDGRPRPGKRPRCSPMLSAARLRDRTRCSTCRDTTSSSSFLRSFSTRSLPTSQTGSREQVSVRGRAGSEGAGLGPVAHPSLPPPMHHHKASDRSRRPRRLMVRVVRVLGGEFGEQFAKRRRLAVLAGVPVDELHRTARPPRRSLR